MKCLPISVAVVLVLFFNSTIFAASFQGLGSFYPSDISADGSVAVGKQSSSGQQAALWSSIGGPVAFAGSDYATMSLAISDDGTVVTGSTGLDQGPAFRWTSTSGVVNLNNLPGKVASTAYGISANGSVIVGSTRTASYVKEAFYWTSAGGMSLINGLPAGTYGSCANGVSADGKVIVGHGESASGREAFSWTPQEGIVWLGDLTGGGFKSTATDISADGSVIVGQGLSGLGFEAFRWTATGGMVGLGDLPGGSFDSSAAAVSANGLVVVGSGKTAWGGYEGFYWTAAAGMRSLKDILSKDCGLDVTGWKLNPTAISADGLTIVGIGINPQNKTEGFIATIPEPATLLLLGLGVIWVNKRVA